MRALDIANALIVRHGRTDYLTNMKLNKLVYFAYAESLRDGRRLFDEQIEAWPYGPVVPSVYHAFRSNGGRAILSPESPSVPAEAAAAADRVWAKYGFMTAIDIMGFSHRDGGAWANVFDERASHQTITDAAILSSGDGVDGPTRAGSVSDAIASAAIDWAEALEILADK